MFSCYRSLNMNVQKITNLDSLLVLPKNQKILTYQINPLTAAGDNYGSIMLKLDITVQTPDGKKELKTVAKLIPPNDFIQEIFNTQVTYRNEVALYKTIVPTLRAFQIEFGVEKVIDFTAKYLGSRLNLAEDSTAKVDGDAVLLLENLQIGGFGNGDRTLGFDLKTTKLILSTLAEFHAVPIALKMHKPDVFDEKIKPHLDTWYIKKEFVDMTKDRIKALFPTIPDISSCLEKALKYMEKVLEPPELREPWCTIVHNDFWVNNIMIQKSNSLSSIKIVDFQVCDYSSLARDIIFFLFTSVQNQIIEKHYDDLIREYYQTLIDILQQLKCDISRFTFENFEKELAYEARNSQFGHIMCMLTPIFATKEEVKPLDEFTEVPVDHQPPSKNFVEKLTLVVEQFHQKNWL